MNSSDYSQLWLDYREIKHRVEEIAISEAPGSDVCSVTASKELRRALKQLFPGVKLTARSGKVYTIKLVVSSELPEETFSLVCEKDFAVITGGSGKALIYGVFSYVRKIIIAEKFPICREKTTPANPLRMLDHWDNPDGSIERGYSGNSFYFTKGRIVSGRRTEMFARALASVGINGVVINNVNVGNDAAVFITEKCFDSLNKLSEIFERYGVKVYLSIDFAAPMDIGGLNSADPLDKKVAGWWKKCCKKLFTSVRNLGGFLVKADSEGRPGPFTYGRTHADGANMLAAALKPFNACVIWRCFVYNCMQDWRDRKTDRARAAFDNFLPLDGKFDDNVILQVKNGPMDFQIREPVHPLFGAMKKTNLMLELQIAQEYTGQQREVCCLLSMFREILDFRTGRSDGGDRVSDVISNGSPFCGIAAVSNTGDDKCWTGSVLAQANLYGFGRIAFEENISPEEIIDEWCLMMFGHNAKVHETVAYILLNSRRVYENYTVPLGLGWMVRPEDHYGPSPMGFEFDRWGTYNFADRNGVGVDRSDKGTGYAMLYNPPLSEIYNSPEKCPDELKLFFHWLPYTYVLSSGKTLLQHLYDTHFEGYEEAEKFAEMWQSLKGKIDPEIFRNGVERFEMQLKTAREWRDVVNTFFWRLSGIPDEKGRKIY